MPRLIAPAEIAARMEWLREVASGKHWSKFTRNGALTELHLLEDIYVA